MWCLLRQSREDRFHWLITIAERSALQLQQLKIKVNKVKIVIIHHWGSFWKHSCTLFLVFLRIVDIRNCGITLILTLHWVERLISFRSRGTTLNFILQGSEIKFRGQIWQQTAAKPVRGWGWIHFHSVAEQNPICCLSLFLPIMKGNDAVGAGHLHQRLSLFRLVKLWRKKKDSAAKQFGIT